MMKNRKGSSLLIVLMILAVTMIFATFTVGFMVTENKQSLYHQHKTQAYYIARSGVVAVEAAILKMDEGQIEKLDGQLDKGEVVVEEIDIDGDKANVVLRRDGEKLYIESVGEKEGVSEKVSKVMNRETTSTENIEINKAIFSDGDMIINNGTINGDIGTNGNIKIDGNPTITGDASMTLDGTLTAPNWWLDQKWSSDREERRTSEIKYPLPAFPNYFEEDMSVKMPEFPVYINYPQTNEVLDVGGSIVTVNSDRIYKKINMNWGGKLIIDTSNSDINIWTEEVNALYQIEVRGSRNVNIHINSRFSTNSGQHHAIIKENNNSRVNIYYSGNDFSTNSIKGVNANLYLKPESREIILNNTKIYGNIYIYNSNLSMTGNSNIGVDGSIFSSGGNIIIPNGSINGDIYANIGDVEVSGSSSMKGNIYSKNGNVVVTGSGNMEGSIYVSKGNAEISGSGRIIEGSLYVNYGDIKFGGSGKINGNILSWGVDNVITMGSNGIPLTVKGMIYAPVTHIEFINNSPLEGGIVGKTVTITGNVKIKYKPEYIDTNLINVESSTSSSISYKPGYFK